MTEWAGERRLQGNSDKERRDKCRKTVERERHDIGIYEKEKRDERARQDKDRERVERERRQTGVKRSIWREGGRSGRREG